MATNAGQFSKSVVTTAGKEMIVQAQNGHTLTFTRVALGDGTLAEGEDMLALAAVKSEKLSADISSFVDKGNGQFQLKFNVNNSTLATGFWHREIGVMAKIDDEEETLYAYSYAGAAATFLYDNTTPIQERLVNIDVLIGNATNVTVVIDGSIVYLTRQDVEIILGNHDSNHEAHKNVYGRFIRQRETAYALKDVEYLPSLGAKFYLECVVAGTTDSGDITLPTPIVENAVVTDGTVTWKIRKISSVTEADMSQIQTELTGKANTTLSNLNTSRLGVHVVIDSVVNTNTGSWYRLYDDGFIIQGGKVSSSSATTQRTITYPHSMNPLSIAVSKSDGVVTSSQPEIVSMGTTSFVEHTANTESNSWTQQCAFCWIATGKV